MKKYVLGFAFNDYHVLLIKKTRPFWQKDLYNVIGGHIEDNETPIKAMVREFEEECGIKTQQSDWEQFCIMNGDDWICYCFRSRNMFELSEANQTTDEVPKIISSYTLDKYKTISNIPALVGLAMDTNAPRNTIMDYSDGTQHTQHPTASQVSDEEIKAMAEKEYPIVPFGEAMVGTFDINKSNRDAYIKWLKAKKAQVSDEEIEKLARKEYPELKHIINAVSQVREIFKKGFKAALHNNKNNQNEKI
jgi:hypothetical protein